MTFVLPYAVMAGGTRVLAIYADRLRRRGHEVTVVSIPQARRSLLGKVKSPVRGRGWPKEPELEPSHFDDIDVPHYWRRARVRAHDRSRREAKCVSRS